MTLLKVDLVGTMSTPITAPIIPLPGGPTVKWSQIGAALMFLVIHLHCSHVEMFPNLIQVEI